MIFDTTPCVLGEGPLWHPLRQSLCWFDIQRCRLFERTLNANTTRMWQFEEQVSAAGWINTTQLLIASERALFCFDLHTAQREDLITLEADNALTRSNDGRADAWGGFWIGTMGKKQEPGAGAIYRYYRGELRQLYINLSIPNSLCFSPQGSYACFCDTPTRQIMRVSLDNNGWPQEEPALYIDLRAQALNPDGSVIDRQGNLWNAQWGAHRVACYDRTGKWQRAVRFSATQISCPAFGGADLSTLFATSASESVDDPASENAGVVYCTEVGVVGQAEHQVIL